MEQAQGQIVYQYFPDELARSRKEHIDGVFRTGKQIQFEDFREGHWFENHVYPIRNESGQVTRVVISAIDLTERMRIEQTLRGAKEELEARVAERTRELSESREQLRALTTDVVTAQEQERRKISRELHDEAGQALVSMKYGLEFDPGRSAKEGAANQEPPDIRHPATRPDHGTDTLPGAQPAASLAGYRRPGSDAEGLLSRVW